MEAKKQTKRIGLGILIAVVALVTLSGAVLAAGYYFWSAQAAVTVVEGVTVRNMGGDDLDFATVSAPVPWDEDLPNGVVVTATDLKPGESKICKVVVANTAAVGSEEIMLVAFADADAVYPAGVTAVWSWDTSNIVSAGSSVVATLTLKAEGYAVPVGSVDYPVDGYKFNVSFTRE